MHLDFAVARVNDSNGGAPVEAVRLGSTHDANAQLHERRALEAWLKGNLPTKPVVSPNPLGPGEITIAPFRLGLQDEVGVVVVASKRMDFPTEFEMIVLRVAANQAVIGLQEARVLKRAEARLRQSQPQPPQPQKLTPPPPLSCNVPS